MKVAIVGTAPSSVNDAPYDDPSWDIWSLGINAGKVRRFTKWFELHTLDVLTAAVAINTQREEFLRKIGKDLYIGHECELFPEATLFPKDDLVKEYGPYFTSSIAWMLALAIHQGAEEIGIWGVDMVGDGEYGYQKACCEYFLGIARGKGITVNISPHSPLLRAERLYAFEHTGLAAELQGRIKEASVNHQRAENTLIKAMEDKAYASGMLHAYHDIERRWG